MEQKIADAGPNYQRIDPHLLTSARKALETNETVVPYEPATAPNSIWYHLKNTPDETVRERLAVQLPVYEALRKDSFKKRLGQTLEIAIFRALQQQGAFDDVLGAFRNLGEHGDDKMYSKEDPPLHLGKRAIGGNRRLDFLVRHPDARWAGIEAKNGREWIYPNSSRDDVTDLLSKCLALDAVPVLIARRIHFSTFLVLNTCGVVIHQTYTQLFPSADAALADQAKHKDNLGYHDIRTGNTPDARLINFISQHLPAILPEHREKFEQYKDLIEAYADGSMLYQEFAARVRRRKYGLNEDNDWPDWEDRENWDPDFDPDREPDEDE